MIALTHLMLAAKSFGVDSCPMEGFVAAQVKSAFDIPEAINVCCLLLLGYATNPITAIFTWVQYIQSLCFVSGIAVSAVL